MAVGQVVVLLILFSSALEVNARERKSILSSQNIFPWMFFQTRHRLAVGKVTRQLRQDKLSYMENPAFFDEFPEPSGSAKIDLPDMLDLPVKIYLAPSWRKLFPEMDGRIEAKKVMSHVKLWFRHPSLKTKFFITYEDSDIDIDIDVELEPTDPGLTELANHISVPRTGSAATVYLTAARGGSLGIGMELSICGSNKKQPRSIIRWVDCTEYTAKTVAHEIGHSLGFYHDFQDKNTEPKPVKTGRAKTCGPGEDKGGPDNQLMNYGEPMVKTWSDCTNEDFKNYYNRVVAKQPFFCLEEHTGELPYIDHAHLPSPAMSCQVPPHPIPHVGIEALTAGSGRILISISISISAICYLSFWFFNHIYIKKKVARLYNENKASMEVSTARIQGRVDSIKEGKEIVSLPWDELTARLKNGSLSAIIVLKAYQAAALDVHKKTNSVVCWVEEAEAQAKMLDSVPVGERGPLHGVPVSVKECYDIVGTYSTAGMALFARSRAEVDSPVVKMIKQLGGVPFCKTNVPQVMYSLQCSNPIYGTSTNPHGNGRECGGSSGGEGALIGGGGSIFGLGSDIGGSLRNPAAFCGCYSLKPTAGRHLSQLGVVAGTGAPAVGITVVGGFMAQSAAAVEAGWRLVWGLDREQNSQRLDTGIMQISWDQKLYDKKPRIGYFTTDGMIDPAPGCVRAVTEAVDKLKNAGFETVPILPPNIHEVMYYFNGIVLAELNSWLYKNMSYDLFDSTLNGVVAAVTVYKLPWLIKKLIINPVLSLLTRIPAVTSVFNTTSKLAEGLSSRDQFTRNYLAEMDSLGVDIILCPGQLLPAPPTGVLGTFVAAVSPYIAWNVMNFPAGIAPITKWSQADEDKMADYPTDDMAYKMIRNYCKEAQGLPLGVQVVGRPFMDEQVLRILSELERAG